MLTDRIRQAVLDLLEVYSQSLTRLHCIGINQGELNDQSLSLSGLSHRLDRVSEHRYQFIMVMMGCSQLARKDEYSCWVFTEYCFDYTWPWLFQSGSSR